MIKNINQMGIKPKILFWINGFFLHFSLAYYLQSSFDANFFGIIDINSNPKKFFLNQTLVKFQNTWFFHDHIKKTEKSPNLSYLENFEKTHKIDLWKLALNERFFYNYNRFYKFTKQEILSILEQECKLFENILNEVKPDYFLTYDPVFHHQKLLLEICRAKGIKVLSLCGTGLDNSSILAENGATLDLDETTLESNTSLISKSIVENQKSNYDSLYEKHLKNYDASFLNKFQALKDYLLSSDSELIDSNFMYYGRNKLKVIKDSLSIEFKRRRHYNFLQNNSLSSPDLKIPFVYFPMNVNEEMNLLHYAPYYTNQIEVIRHIAKSIPIDYMLYVKEHIAAGLRSWNEIEYYNEIIDIPNVKLINPKFDNNVLLKNSQLIITIRGTSSLKAMKFGIPSIVFGERPEQIMPSVFKVDSLNSLPQLIKIAIEHKVDNLEYEKFKELLKNRIFEFNMLEFGKNRDKSFFSGGILSNVIISNDDVVDFLHKNKNLLLPLLNAHLKILSSNTSSLK